jgi:hypothetical protein
MELIQHPAVITFLIGSALAFTVWLLRLEGLLKTIERDHARLEKNFADHENDASIHPSEKSLTEFKIQFEKRFDQLGRMVEKSNDEVKVSLKDLNTKLDTLTIKRSST